MFRGFKHRLRLGLSLVRLTLPHIALCGAGNLVGKDEFHLPDVECVQKLLTHCVAFALGRG